MPISRIFYRDIRSETNLKKLFEIEINGIKEIMPAFHGLIHNFYLGEDTKKAAERVHEIECKIDVIKKKIDREVYESRFFPLSFRDRVELGNAIDNIADIIEDITKKVQYEGVKPIKYFQADIFKMLELIETCLEKTILCTKHFYDFNIPISVINKDYCEICELENKIDEKQLILLERLSKSKKDILNIILFREFIRMMSNVADACVNLGESILIISEGRI